MQTAVEAPTPTNAESLDEPSESLQKEQQPPQTEANNRKHFKVMICEEEFVLFFFDILHVEFDLTRLIAYSFVYFFNNQKEKKDLDYIRDLFILEFNKN